MFCNHCGKEVANGARFCNYCGAPVTAAPAQPAPQSVPVQQPQAEPAAQQPEEKKKKNPLVTIIIAVAVFFLVRSLTTNMLTNNSKPSSNTSSQSSGLINLTKESPLSTCYYGALYENGTLTYGSARVRLSGYTLLDGTGSEPDYLMSADESVLLAVDKTLEVNASFDASDEQGILDSFVGSSFSNVKMVSFNKYTVAGYPVIRYIVSCTADGTDQYVGELIIMPNENPTETMRLSMYALKEVGSGPINQVFDSLSLSPAYALKPGDTQATGIKQITVK